MAPSSVLLSVATYVPETERDALAVAASLALGSILLVVVSWSRLPKFMRALGSLVLLMAGFSVWTLVERSV